MSALLLVRTVPARACNREHMVGNGRLDGDEHCLTLRTPLNSANSMSSRQPRVCPASMSKSPTAGHHAVTAEQISINLQAVPLVDAFGRFVESANPFAFWAQLLRM